MAKRQFDVLDGYDERFNPPNRKAGRCFFKSKFGPKMYMKGKSGPLNLYKM